MKILVFGSLNIDKVYSLSHLPEKGETLYCNNYEIHVGGKGLNQAVALSKSGSDVFMAGAVGKDGQFLIDCLNRANVNTGKIMHTDGYTGHAVIEVDTEGQNQMILFSGANGEITEKYCDEVLSNFEKGDLILMQYETSCVEYMIEKAREKGLTVALNPSPFSDKIKNLPFELIDYLILNETEAQGIAEETNIDYALDKLKTMVKNGAIVLTLGSDGAIYSDKNTTEKVRAFKVNAVDTTGAGDTYTGYFLTSVLSGKDIKTSMLTAAAASAIVVTKTGAAETIPLPEEVNNFLKQK